MTVILTEIGRYFRAARLTDGMVDDFYFVSPERSISLLGNIYQGIVRRVDKKLSSFFVDVGLPQNVLVKIPHKNTYQEGQVCIIEITRDAPIKKDVFKGPRGKVVPTPLNLTLLKGPACLVVYDYVKAFIGESDVLVNSPHIVGYLRTIGIFPEQITFKPNVDLFDAYDLADIWASLMSKTVSLPCGGEIIFDDTAAMTVIDVNSSGVDTATRSALASINCAAATEIAHQIKWRHLSGMILIDFIGGKQDLVAQNLLDLMIHDCAKDPAVTVHGITRLGLMEITRQQTGPPLSSMNI